MSWKLCRNEIRALRGDSRTLRRSPFLTPTACCSELLNFQCLSSFIVSSIPWMRCIPLSPNVSIHSCVIDYSTGLKASNAFLRLYAVPLVSVNNIEVLTSFRRYLLDRRTLTGGQFITIEMSFFSLDFPLFLGHLTAPSNPLRKHGGISIWEVHDLVGNHHFYQDTNWKRQIRVLLRTAFRVQAWPNICQLNELFREKIFS